jgi:hypothetical protein
VRSESHLIIALQKQAAIGPLAALASIPAAQGIKLASKFAGKPADYKVSLPPAFTFANKTTVANRIYVDTRAAQRRAVVFRRLSTTAGKTTVLDVPSKTL